MPATDRFGLRSYGSIWNLLNRFFTVHNTSVSPLYLKQYARHTVPMFGLTPKELKVLQSIGDPLRAQDFLERLPRNHEKKGATLMSPRRVLRERKAHCIEGALLVALAFWLRGRPALILDLETTPEDDSHVVALFKENGYWGAVSKTNHATLGYRDPIYKNIRELALSYFHEYFLDETGKKTLQGYARYNIKRLGTRWITAEEELLHLNDLLHALPHLPLIPSANRKLIRDATTLEIKASELLAWRRADPRT